MISGAHKARRYCRDMMKNIRSIVGLTILALATSTFAQQLPQYTHFMTNEFLVNPAVSGIEDWVDIKTGYRNQWTGFESHVQNNNGNASQGTTDNSSHDINLETQYLTVHSPIGKPHHARTAQMDDHNWIGLGMIIANDVTAPTKRQFAYLNASYNLQLTESKAYGDQRHDALRLAFGMNVGMQRLGLVAAGEGGLDYLQDEDIVNGNRGIGNHIDPTILDLVDQGNNNWAKNEFDGTLGAMIYFGELFQIGFTTYQIFKNRIDAVTGELNTVENGYDLRRLTRHHIFTASSKFGFDDTKRLFVMPSILVKKTDASPPSVDLNLRFDWTDNIYGGVTYRVGDAIAATVGLLYDLTPERNIHKQNHFDLEVAYSYDATLSSIRRYSQGSHEIIVGMRITPKFVERNAEGTKQWNKKDQRDMKHHSGANHHKRGHPSQRKQKKRRSMGH